jgi:agmatinase
MTPSQPPFSGIRTFLGAPHAKTCTDETDVAIAGVPFDIGTTYRSGQRFGPQAIREASLMLTDNDNPRFRQDPLKILDVVDLGDFDIVIGDTLTSLQMIADQVLACPARQLISLGGDHTISLPLLRAVNQKHGRVALVHFDAHVDTWEDNFGAELAHGSPFYLAVQEELIDAGKSIQIGIRSPVENEVMDWTLEQGFSILSAEQVHLSTPQAIAEQIIACVGRTPAYLSFDVDALDPSQAPGTGTPEIGGLWSWQLLAILERLKGINWVGMDCVEVLPAHDVSQITALAGATVVWMYLGIHANARND